MFGIANQLLACTALCVGTTIILREGKRKVYALVTLGPLLFVGTTTITAGIQSVRVIFLPLMANEATANARPRERRRHVILLVCVTMVICGSAWRWWALARAPKTEPILAA